MRYRTQDRIRKLSYLVKRWWLFIFLFVLAVLGVTYWVTHQIPARYQAFASLEVKTNEDAVRAEDFNPNVNPAEYLSTQLMRLKSGNIINAILDDPILMETLNNTLEPPQESLSRKQWVQNIQDNLDVSYLGNSRILKVLYTSPDRDLSAYVPNQIVKVFENTVTTKITSVGLQEKENLEIQLTQAKEKLWRSEQALVQYATRKGILTTTNTILSRESVSKGLMASRLKSLQKELDSVQTQKTIAEKNYETYSGENVDVSQIENAQLRLLREQRRVAIESYDKGIDELGEFDLKSVQLKQEIERLDLAIEQSLSAIVSSNQALLAQLTEREANLEERIENTTLAVNEIQADSVKYDQLQREVESFRTEYEGLLQRVKNLAAKPENMANSVYILDYARPPLRPVSPNLKLNLLLAGFCALLTSFLIVSLLSLLDNRVSSPDDVIDGIGVPLLGVIPKFRRRNLVLDLFEDPLSTVAEAYSTARIRLENLNLNQNIDPPKCIQVTSTRAGEGKSLTSLAIARSYGVVGYKTLLIDADLRLPSFRSDQLNPEGLSGVLIQKNDGRDAVIKTKLENLSLLEAGNEPEDPAGLLGANHIEDIVNSFRQEYDRIVIDGPPVLGLSDALLISRLVDGVVIVTQSNALPFRAVISTIKAMQGAGKPILGIIMTKYKPSHGRHSHHYSKYTYGKLAMKYGRNSKGQLGKGKGKKKISL